MLLLNDEHVKWFKFPGGEVQVKLPESYRRERVILTWKPKSSDSIMKLLLTVNALHYDGVSDIDLDVLYLPYARQDRVCNPGESASIEVVLGLLDCLQFEAIRVWDPHNRASLLNIDNCGNYQVVEVRDIFKSYQILNKFNLNNLVLCAPDLGAAPRVHAISYPSHYLDKIYCNKTRNSSTGQIIDTSVPLFKIGADVLVIDDICDGGATFLELAEKLDLQQNCKKYLYVTHGIFSKGLDDLLKHYDHIICHHVLDDNKYQSFDKLTILREYPVEN